MKKTDNNREKINIVLSVVVMFIMAALVVFVSGRLSTDVSEDESNSVTKDDEEDKLIVWYYDSIYTDYLNALSKEYEKKYDVELEVVKVSPDGYLEAINTASTNDDEYPDLYILPEEMLEKAYLGGLAQINEHDKQYSEDNFSSVALSSITYKNKKIAYPLSFDTCFLAYNKEYTEGAPESFEGIIEYAENFDGENYPDVKTVIEWNPSDILYNYGFVGAYMECGGINGDDASVFDVTNDKVKDSLKYYKKLQEYFSIDIESANDKSVKTDFVKGKIVYTLAGMDYYNYFLKKELKLGVAKFPNLNKDLQSRSLSMTNVIVVNPFSDYLREAEKLAMYMTYDKPEMVYEYTGRLAPAFYEYEYENLNIILDCYAQSTIMPKLMNSLDYKQRLQNTLNVIWNGGSIKDNLNKLRDEMSMEMKK
ncbi:MAG: extracellular solute-binding protein [Lachnospiraceae bacterium]|nr:extracellular solute-binding protein [Lachnospiraceae bacterium]